MSGTFPTSPAPSDVEIVSVTTTLVSMGQSMSRQARTKNGQRWSFKLTYAPLTRAQWAVLFAFLVAQRGRYETFQYALPAPLSTPQGSYAGSPVVDNTVGSPTVLQTLQRVINLRGFTPSQSSVIKAGDFLKYAGHSKIYMATADANSDSSGKVQLSQEPALLAGPADGEVVSASGLMFTVALAEDQLTSPLQVNPQFGLTLNLMEAY